MTALRSYLITASLAALVAGLVIYHRAEVKAAVTQAVASSLDLMDIAAAEAEKSALRERLRRAEETAAAMAARHDAAQAAHRQALERIADYERENPVADGCILHLDLAGRLSAP